VRPRGKQGKSYGRTAKRGALWSVVRQGGHELIAIPMSMIMARLLTPTEFGITVAASFFILLAARLGQFGFPRRWCVHVRSDPSTPHRSLSSISPWAS
jgi:hypothetical protein